MVKLTEANKKLRDTIHEYLGNKEDLSSVKMKDLRTHIQNTLGISIEELKGEVYKPLVEIFAAEYIIPPGGESSKSKITNSTPSTIQSSTVSQINSTVSSTTPLIIGRATVSENFSRGRSGSVASSVQAAANSTKDITISAKQKKRKTKKVDAFEAAAENVTPQQSSAGETLASTAKVPVVEIKRGKFSQAESEIVKTAIDEYCRMNNIEPTTIMKFFRSSGVVEKYVKPLKEGKEKVAKPTLDTDVRELLDNAVEDEEIDEDTNAHTRNLYKTLYDLFPNRLSSAVRQHANRLLLTTYLPTVKFTEVEDTKLLELVEQVGRKFTIIGRALGRRPDDCKQALIRLQRTKSGVFSIEEDRALIAAVYQQLRLTENADPMPTTGIRWVDIVRDLAGGRTQLDYLRRWRSICNLNKRYNYPYNPQSLDIEHKNQTKILSATIKNSTSKESTTKATTTKTRKDKTQKEDDKSSSSSSSSDNSDSEADNNNEEGYKSLVLPWKERLRFRIQCMERMQATGEVDSKGVNFSVIDGGSHSNGASSLWRRIKEELPPTLQNKEFALQEQLSFMLLVYRRTLNEEGDDSKNNQSSSTTEAGDETEKEENDMKKRYRYLRTVEKRVQKSAMARDDNDGDDDKVDKEKTQLNSSEQQERLTHARRKVAERINRIVHQRWQRLLNHYTAMYEEGTYVPAANQQQQSGATASSTFMSLFSPANKEDRRLLIQQEVEKSRSPVKRPQMERKRNSRVVVRAVDDLDDEESSSPDKADTADKAEKAKKTTAAAAAATKKVAAKKPPSAGGTTSVVAVDKQQAAVPPVLALSAAPAVASKTEGRRKSAQVKKPAAKSAARDDDSGSDSSANNSRSSSSSSSYDSDAVSIPEEPLSSSNSSSSGSRGSSTTSSSSAADSGESEFEREKPKVAPKAGSSNRNNKNRTTATATNTTKEAAASAASSAAASQVVNKNVKGKENVKPPAAAAAVTKPPVSQPDVTAKNVSSDSDSGGSDSGGSDSSEDSDALRKQRNTGAEVPATKTTTKSVQKSAPTHGSTTAATAAATAAKTVPAPKPVLAAKPAVVPTAVSAKMDTAAAGDIFSDTDSSDSDSDSDGDSDSDDSDSAVSSSSDESVAPPPRPPPQKQQPAAVHTKLPPTAAAAAAVKTSIAHNNSSNNNSKKRPAEQMIVEGIGSKKMKK